MRPIHLLLGVTVLLGFSPSAFARGLVVSPSQLGLVGSPGATVSDAIYISSSREERNNIQVGISDFTRKETGELLELPTSNDPRSCREWLEVDQTFITTPETGRIELRVTAKVPKDAQGSYWALVSFRSLPPARASGEGNTIRVIPRIVVPVIVTVAGTEKRDLKITALTASSASNGVDAEATVVNQGNAAVLFSGAFTLESNASNGEVTELTEAPVETLTSLPGSTTRVKAHLKWSGGVTGLRVGAVLRYGPGPSEVAEATAPVSDDGGQAILPVGLNNDDARSSHYASRR